MRRHPVEQYANTLLMQVIDEVLKILRRPETTGWSIIPGYLIPPGAIIGILGDGEQLDMSKSHLLDIGCQHVGQLAISREARLPRHVLPLPFKHMPPRARMDLIDGYWLRQRLPFGALLYPRLILSPVTMNICDNACCVWAQFKGKSVRARLLCHVMTGFAGNRKFIKSADLCSWNETFPDAQITMAQVHRVFSSLPAVKVAYYRDLLGMRRPDGKIGARYFVDGAGMGSHFFIEKIMLSLPEQV